MNERGHPPAAPRVDQGVTQADVDAYGLRCYEAGRTFQRGQTDRRSRDEVDAEIQSALEPARLEGRRQALAEVHERLDFA